MTFTNSTDAFVKTKKRHNLDYLAEAQENQKVKSKKQLRDMKRNRGGRYVLESQED